MMRLHRPAAELSGGKPVGFKLCIGHPWEFMAIVKAMLETGILPDFIVVDGAEGGTGAAPVEFADHLGVPMREGLLFVHNTLVGAGLRDKIRHRRRRQDRQRFRYRERACDRRRLGQCARGFMFALGCIQSHKLPHQPLSHRRGDAGSDSPARARRAGQGASGSIISIATLSRRSPKCWRRPASNTPVSSVRTILFAG